MPRPWRKDAFDAAYRDHICTGIFQEEGDYYPRYIARYRDVMQLYARHAPEGVQDVLDIGGGQFAVLASKLFGDNAHMADIGGPHLEALRGIGVTPHQWNLVETDAPFSEKFDTIFFSEVLEHLLISSPVVLARLRRCLKPGGLLICTTPNLHRLRNVAYMVLGRQIFDFFRVDPSGKGVGHVTEFSREHLAWHLTSAGYRDVQVELRNIAHSPVSLSDRLGYWLGQPITWIPRYRDCLFAVARN
jgi:SAM-dependent methyltransferase